MERRGDEKEKGKEGGCQGKEIKGYIYIYILTILEQRELIYDVMVIN